MLTHARLIWHLNYNKKTGKFTHLVGNGRYKAGSEAGFKRGNGIGIGIAGLSFKAEDLAWMYCYGEMPKGEIAHQDGDPRKNKISNLRDSGGDKPDKTIQVVKSVIRKNMGGVAVDKETGKWCVSDFIGVVKSGFETSDEAYEFAVEHFKLIRK